MRLIYVAIIGGCLLGLVAGCGGGSDRVEMPTNPTPPPKNPPVFGPKSVDSKKDVNQKQLSLPPAAGQAQPRK
ncbi:MAG: hypothetical protein KKA28_16190 [Planctomycetes bacterium]|nr:hypothetical protein [Planctomycetota bacterium]MCG2682079.1 hypothetical protein [Planctomycetales bacterium]